MVLNVVLLLVAAVPVPAADHMAPADYAPNEIIVKFREAAADVIEKQVGSQKQAQGLTVSRNLDDLAARYRLKEIRPVFKDFKKNRQQVKTLLKKDKTLLTKKEKHILKRLKRAPKGAKVPDLSRIYKIELDLEPGQSLEEVVAEYNADPDVEYAELNYIVSINLTPDDPLYPIQWSLHNTGQMYPESGRFNPPPGTPDCDIDAPEAWDMETGSSEIIVAVVDTGVDYRHRDLQANMWTDANGHYGYDFYHKDNNPMDDHGHGTHCAGTIAAAGNNGMDIAGVCWDARIMAVKFLDSSGSGYMEDGAAALYYAVENGADVTSNSWGSFFDYPPMEEAIDYAHSQGVITVAAAGNGYSTYAHYPAYYEHVISVAATDSDDEKAFFSTYGDWVDIAAPGVDILSLRAGGTAMGTMYNAYTTIASGTSMACPHVAGACALLLSADPELTDDQVYNILMETVEPIAPEICISGRINLFEAMLEVILPKGRIKLDADYYGCSDQIGARLNDLDLAGEGSHAVTVTTDGGDSETFVLTEAVPGSFTGSIPTGSGDPCTEDGVVQVIHDEVITATYYDADDGTGSPATEQDWATIDCEPPSIFNIHVDLPGPEPTVSFETNEPTSGRVLCGTACGPPYTIEGTDLSPRTSHTIRLTGVSPETDYFFVVEVADRAGNTSEDSNEGECYAFTSTGPNDVIYVPDEAATIQQAIDICWEGGTVVVAEGTYTGLGNRDISFRGKAITVRSMNPDDPCVVAATVIDCNGTKAEPHRGFYFENREGRDSILSGFTITNGYEEYGGAICCDLSGPTISNCTIIGNGAWEGGGIGNYYFCSPAIINCTITGNTAGQQGAGLCRCNGPIVNCTITGNRATRWGGGVSRCNGPIVNCTITGNRAGVGAGGLHWCHGMITHCIIWDNKTATSSAPLYSCVQGGSSGTGCISSDPCFVTPGYWDGDTWVEGDCRLSAESLCIDAGNYYYMTLPLTDCGGNLRLAGEQIDMGCYEFGSSPDTDGDLLADSNESGSENDPDRDNDGMLDGVEILRGTDPDVFDPLGQWNVPTDANTIQEALFFSRHGETITLSEGTYRENIYIVDRNIMLTSTNPSDPGVVAATIINGDTDADSQTRNGRVITLARADETACHIRGLTITGGDASGSHGGGIKGSAGITNCVITGNRASYHGGGVSSCRGWIVDCMIIDNVAGSWDGGGLCSCNGPIVNCTITGNSAGDDGGGMAWCEGPIANCTITGNSAGDDGGGMARHSLVPLSNCTIAGNSAAVDGGGIFNWARAELAAINNCIITGNLAGRDGAGVYNDFGFGDVAVIISNCTISGNSAEGKGGGIHHDSTVGLITDSIIWDNNGPDGPQIYGRPSVTYSDIEGGYTGEGNIDADPCFVFGPLGDYYLSQVTAGHAEDSPCVDVGSDLAVNVGMDICTTRTDEIGDSGIVDMGYHYPTPLGSFTCWDAAECAGQPNGDATCNGSVDFADLFALKAGFGGSAPWTGNGCCADFNHDDSVNLGDLFVMKAGFGTFGHSPSTGNQDCPP